MISYYLRSVRFLTYVGYSSNNKRRIYTIFVVNFLVIYQHVTYVFYFIQLGPQKKKN